MFLKSTSAKPNNKKKTTWSSEKYTIKTKCTTTILKKYELSFFSFTFGKKFFFWKKLLSNIESEAYKIILFIIMRMNVNKVLYGI